MPTPNTLSPSPTDISKNTACRESARCTMDPNQIYRVLSRFDYADATCCAWRAVTTCSDFDTQPKAASASTSEAS
jgi:hypothetical protein